MIIAVLGDNAGGGGTTTPGAISLSAPPNIVTQSGACTKVLEQLPVQLNKLAPRIVHPRPETPFVVAWGDPAVILRCGVDKPASLHVGSTAQFFDGGDTSGPYFDVTSGGSDSNVYTTVDRAAYVSITVPGTYQGSSIITPLATAIGHALPAVCNTADTAPLATLCTRRK